MVDIVAQKNHLWYSKKNSLLLKLSQGDSYKQERDSRYEHLKPLLEYYAKESKRPKVTLLMLWEEYKQQFQDDAYSYSSFKNHVQEYINSHTYTYHNTHKPGDVLQVDFAGDHLYLTDPNTAEKISVVVLCGTLPCSGYTFAYALPDASQENLFPALSRCLSYIGGVPNKILSDSLNLRIYVMNILISNIKDLNIVLFTNKHLFYLRTYIIFAV